MMPLLNPNWLKPNAVIPIDAETTRLLVDAVIAQRSALKDCIVRISVLENKVDELRGEPK